MSQGPLCPNLTQKVQKEVSQMSNRNFPIGMLLGGLSVNLNHLKKQKTLNSQLISIRFYFAWLLPSLFRANDRLIIEKFPVGLTSQNLYIN